MLNTSTGEYTEEEKKKNGNGVYGGKRHDEICDYLQEAYKFNETEINNISIGVWMGIEAERKVWEEKTRNEREEIENLKQLLYETEQGECL